MADACETTNFHLRQIDDLWGVFYSRMVVQSETLRQYLARQPVQLSKVANLRGGMTDTFSIKIGSDLSPAEFSCILGHEFYHYFAPTPDVKSLSREEFVEAMLLEEAQAQCEEIKVMQELWDAGTHFEQNWRWKLQVKPGDRLDYFLGHVRDARTCDAKIPYTEYYGGFWDEVHSQIFTTVLDWTA